MTPFTAAKKTAQLDAQRAKVERCEARLERALEARTAAWQAWQAKLAAEAELQADLDYEKAALGIIEARKPVDEQPTIIEAPPVVLAATADVSTADLEVADLADPDF